MPSGIICQRCKNRIDLQAIRFCPFCGQEVSGSEHESREVAIVFADIAGFSSLSQQVDADLLRTEVDRLMTRLAQVVETKEGKVDKIIGDSIMFVFGLDRPLAEDASRLLEAVEEMRREATRLNESSSLSLNLHFGVAAGEVSVGKVGTATTVMGEAVNLAARFLEIAGPNEIVVSDAFVSRAAGAFDFAQLPAFHPRGFRDPIRPFKYLGQRKVSVSALLHAVGREEEMDRFTHKLENLSGPQGGGHVVLHGPAGGIGKSSLLREMRRSAFDRGLSVFTLYFEDGGGEVLEPFETLLVRLKALAPQTQDASDEIRNPEEIRKEIGRRLDEVSTGGGALFQAEDLHRAESSAQKLWEEIQKDAQGKAILFVSTSQRMEGIRGEPWEVAPLDPVAGEALFRQVVGVSDQARISWEKILGHCGGHPLWIRELARAIRRGVPQEKLFPGKVTELLASTLESFVPADRSWIEMAAVFGTRIPLQALAQLMEESTEIVADRLLRTGLFLYVEGESALFFEHDLFREAAYRSMNRSVQQECHGKVAELLATQTEASPTQVAYHYLRSGKKRDALPWVVRAGQWLGGRGIQEESLFYLHNAQDLALEFGEEDILADVLEARLSAENAGGSVEARESLLSEWSRDPTLAAYPEVVRRINAIRSSR